MLLSIPTNAEGREKRADQTSDLQWERKDLNSLLTLWSPVSSEEEGKEKSKHPGSGGGGVWTQRHLSGRFRPSNISTSMMHMRASEPRNTLGSLQERRGGPGQGTKNQDKPTPTTRLWNLEMKEIFGDWILGVQRFPQREELELSLEENGGRNHA